jgi:hypothetical protein
MNLPDNDEYQKIRKGLRKASIDRNAKTALIIGAAASGAFFGLTGLAITAAGATIAVSVTKWRQDHLDS